MGFLLKSLLNSQGSRGEARYVEALRKRKACNITRTRGEGGKFVFKDPRPIRVRPPPRPHPTLLAVGIGHVRGAPIVPLTVGAREFSGGSQHGQEIFRGDPPMVSGVAE